MALEPHQSLHEEGCDPLREGLAALVRLSNAFRERAGFRAESAGSQPVAMVDRLQVQCNQLFDAAERFGPRTKQRFETGFPRNDRLLGARLVIKNSIEVKWS
jgi:hypothetical protein